ncbi:hypothetical protein FKM82_012229 [Ascaphus truei]
MRPYNILGGLANFQSFRIFLEAQHFNLTLVGKTSYVALRVNKGLDEFIEGNVLLAITAILHMALLGVWQQHVHKCNFYASTYTRSSINK